MGLALAPAGFGGLGGALLVGNFGDGHINAYNSHTRTHLGTSAPSSDTRAPYTQGARRNLVVEARMQPVTPADLIRGGQASAWHRLRSPRRGTGLAVRSDF